MAGIREQVEVRHRPALHNGSVESNETDFGQIFKETRTDLEVTISGTGTENLRVVEVIKPIIREGTRDLSRITQKGIVIVESATEKKEN